MLKQPRPLQCVQMLLQSKNGYFRPTRNGSHSSFSRFCNPRNPCQHRPIRLLVSLYPCIVMLVRTQRLPCLPARGRLVPLQFSR